jgi:hypothetical protein
MSCFKWSLGPEPVRDEQCGRRYSFDEFEPARNGDLTRVFSFLTNHALQNTHASEKNSNSMIVIAFKNAPIRIKDLISFIALD